MAERGREDVQDPLVHLEVVPHQLLTHDRDVPRHLVEAGQQLRLDVECARLARELRNEALEFILLKGPAVAQWLYPSGGRQYGDVDLLANPSALESVGRVLRSLGYVRRVDVPAAAVNAIDRASYAFSWRSDDFLVEVHQTLVGINARPDEVWRVLSAEPESIRVAATSVPALRLPARALHLALHAAQHGPGVEKSLEDLRRGLAKEEPKVWAEAFRLAVELQAVAAFTSGLALLPEGKAMLGALGISFERSLDVELHAAHARSSARSLEWFRSLPLPSKGRWILQKTVPSPTFMRLWHPLARRNRLGLLFAYLWRPIWLSKELALGLVERRRVRRDVERQDGGHR